MKIRQFDLVITDIYEKVNKVYPAIEIIDDNKNSIVFSKQFIIDNIIAEIDTAKAMSSHEYDYCSNMNCNLSTYIKTLKGLIKLVNGLNAYGILKISENLPKNGWGHIKDSVLPVYMTGIYKLDNPNRISSIELSLCPWIVHSPMEDSSIFISPVIKVKNKFIINFTNTRKYEIHDNGALNLTLVSQECK